MHGQECPAAAREVLDVAVAAVFGAAGDRARAFAADLRQQVCPRGGGVDVAGLGRLRDDAFEVGTVVTVVVVGGDELGFAAVPLGENFRRGRAAQDARVDQAREADVGDVSRGGEDAFKVPDCFGPVYIEIYARVATCVFAVSLFQS